MSELTPEAADRIVASWRGGGVAVSDWESPAGPVFASGEFAESDITMEAIFAASGCPGTPQPGTNICGTACTYSAGRQCC